MTDDAVPALPVLDRNDLASPTWRKLKEHMERLLEQQRRSNDDRKHDAVATAYLRGDIRRLKNLLALASPAPIVAANEDQPE